MTDPKRQQGTGTNSRSLCVSLSLSLSLRTSLLKYPFLRVAKASWKVLFASEAVGDAEFNFPPRGSKLSAVTKWALNMKGTGVKFADDRALQIGMGKPLPELPRNKFNVVFIRRYYRDGVWIFLFALYWAVQISLSVYAFANGAPERLFSGFDSLGEICGNTANNTYGIDYSTRTKVFYPDGSSGSRGLCVAACPSAGDNVTDYIYASATGQVGAAFYNVNVSTIDIANRCLPVSGGTTIVGSTVSFRFYSSASRTASQIPSTQ